MQEERQRNCLLRVQEERQSLSSYTRKRQYTRRRQFLSKALVHYCFLEFRHTGEYISQDHLFFWIKEVPFHRSLSAGCLPKLHSVKLQALVCKAKKSDHIHPILETALATSNTSHSIQNVNYLLQLHLWNSPSVSVRFPSTLYSSKTITICI